MNCRSLLFFPMIACGGRVADEIEQALWDVNDAIAVSLLVAEPHAWADVEISTTTTTTTTTPEGTGGTGLDGSAPSGLRHGAAGNCPELTRLEDGVGSYTVSADYGTGCVSGSGLTPTVLSGSVSIGVVQDQVGINFSSWKADLSRNVFGTTNGVLGDEPDTVTVSGNVILEDAGSFRYEAAVNLSLNLAGDEVQIDGEVNSVDSDRVQLEGVRIRLSDIPGQCPRPFQGLATVTGEAPDRVVDFSGGADAPVEVQRKGRRSQPTPLCAFASEVF